MRQYRKGFCFGIDLNIFDDGLHYGRGSKRWWSSAASGSATTIGL
jgi:hypothetical protein